MSSGKRVPAGPEDYSWLLEDLPAFGVAGCVTMIEGGDQETVLSALGVDPSHPPVSDREALYESGTPSVAFADQQAGWLPMIEWNGFIGADRTFLEQISRARRVGSCFWNVNGDCRLSLATDGHLVYSFAVGMSDSEIVGDVEAAKKMQGSLPGPASFVEQWGMAMLEQLTGVPVTPQTIKQAGAFYVVPQ